MGPLLRNRPRPRHHRYSCCNQQRPEGGTSNNSSSIPEASEDHLDIKPNRNVTNVYLIEKIPKLFLKKIAMVTDREKAVSNAIIKLLPNSVNLFCWNHLKRDFNFGYKKKTAPDSAAAALEQEDVCDDIPVKKIKLECKEGSDKVIQDEKLVSGLKVSHKKNILDPKGWLCSDIVNYSLDIIKKQFENIHGLQLTNLAPLFDEQTKSWKCDNKFEHAQPPSVQIHHTGRSHWVTSFQNNNNEICILDSLSKSKNQTVNTPSLEIQLSYLWA